MNELLDTNVILRYLVGDNEEQQQKATAIFKEAEQGKRKIFLKVVVVAETCFVLESFYKKTKDEIASAMEVFLSQKSLPISREAMLYIAKNMNVTKAKSANAITTRKVPTTQRIQGSSPSILFITIETKPHTTRPYKASPPNTCEIIGNTRNSFHSMSEPRLVPTRHVQFCYVLYPIRVKKSSSPHQPPCLP